MSTCCRETLARLCLFLPETFLLTWPFSGTHRWWNTSLCPCRKSSPSTLHASLCSLHAPGLPSSREQVAALRFFSSGERKRQDTKQCLVSFREHTALLFFSFFFSLNSTLNLHGAWTCNIYTRAKPKSTHTRTDAHTSLLHLQLGHAKHKTRLNPTESN